MPIVIPAPGLDPYLVAFNLFVREQREQALREEGQPKESGAALSASGAAQGAAAGMTFGPWGALAGAGIGALTGEKRKHPGTGPYAQAGNIEQDNAAIMQGMQNVAASYVSYQAGQRAIEQDSLRLKLGEARLEALTGTGDAALNAFIKASGGTRAQYNQFKAGLEEKAQASLPNSDVLDLFAAQVQDETQRQKFLGGIGKAENQLFTSFINDPKSRIWTNEKAQTQHEAYEETIRKLRTVPGTVREEDVPAEIARIRELQKPGVLAYTTKPPKQLTAAEIARQRVVNLAELDIPGIALVFQPDGTALFQKVPVDIPPEGKVDHGNGLISFRSEAGKVQYLQTETGASAGPTPQDIQKAYSQALGLLKGDSDAPPTIETATPIANELLAKQYPAWALRNAARRREQELLRFPPGSTVGMSPLRHGSARGQPLGQQGPPPTPPTSQPPSPTQQAQQALTEIGAAEAAKGRDKPSEWTEKAKKAAQPAARVLLLGYLQRLREQGLTLKDLSSEERKKLKQLDDLVEGR